MATDLDLLVAFLYLGTENVSLTSKVMGGNLATNYVCGEIEVGKRQGDGDKNIFFTIMLITSNSMQLGVVTWASSFLPTSTLQPAPSTAFHQYAFNKYLLDKFHLGLS